MGKEIKKEQDAKNPKIMLVQTFVLAMFRKPWLIED